MPTMCIQCAMRAMLNNEPAPIFAEEPEEHRRLAHPNQIETNREREELERRLREKILGSPE